MEPVERARSASEQARAAGESAVASIRRSVSERLADLIRSDPEWAAQAAEVGLIDRTWLDDPTGRPFRTAPPAEMVERFLERTSERRPSVLASVGLNALQALSLVRATSDEDAVPVEVTVMFTDLEGFTRYTAEHGDEAAVALVSEHQRQVGPIVRSRGGRIVKRMGDGLMLAFPAPEAAVLAGLELVDAVEVPLRLRAGIHIGEAVVTHDDIVGHAVNVAARITEGTQAGTVLVSVDVREAVSREADGVLRGVTFGRARRYKLKGLEPVSLCRVEREW
ncbi:MAG TPA: adenylate/guanylate cyclase domain-containing protein [Acidimicrobiales bacterium]|nr:adenylate/guanylate cyclase domain-containing protein [Acidimicrobiales bacterium]